MGLSLRQPLISHEPRESNPGGVGIAGRTTLGEQNKESDMSENIEGKVVVITGASSGLGEATARLLSAQGAGIVLGAWRVERLRSLAGELTVRGGKALAVTSDVTDRDQVRGLVDASVNAYRRAG
jgi:hypothetical protein